MPTEIAATESASARPRPTWSRARRAATYAPEIAAQRVPPSASRGRSLQLGERDRLDRAERQLEKALAEDAEPIGIAGREEAVGALAGRRVADPLPLQGLGDLGRGLLGGEHERDVASEDS